MNKAAAISASIVLMLLTLSSGCTVTRTVHVDYQPRNIRELSTLATKAFYVSVVDERPTAERASIGHGGKVVYALEGQATTVIGRLLGEALTAHSHRIVPNITEADVVVEIRLRRLWREAKETSGAKLEDAVFVQFEALVSNPQHPSGNAAIPVSVVSQRGSWLVGAPNVSRITEQALNDAIQQLLIDQRFLQVCEKSR
ncbi:MAG TPA: hypothetical protein PK082_09250 [Phycisphaerae bacterium]|nr:hypothetical protein [Phycisphaerae bacterium]